MSFGQYLNRGLKIQCAWYHQRLVQPDITNHGLTHLSRDYAAENNVVIIKPEDLAWRRIGQTTN